MTQQIGVSQKIQNFVSHKFVRKAQGVIKYAFIADDHSAFQTSTAYQARLLKHFDFPEKTEGARRRQLMLKRIFRNGK